MMQPWEYGSLPASWVTPLATMVDEIWANTRYVQDVCVQSGIPADRVHLVPLGVDTAAFCPGRPPFALQTRKTFKFLFVGGTIFRKGIDVLLDAYAAVFRRSDDVCLVIKDMGVDTFYQGQTAEERIAQLQGQADAPEIEYWNQTLTAAEMASLYCSCDCLVHPCRGEGFGLPVAEAMSCGLPAIVTGMGAVLDFCNDANAFLIPAQKRYFSSNRVGDIETVDRPWLAEPNAQAVRHHMQEAVRHPEQVRQKGEAACSHVRQHFRWEQAVAAAERRLLALREQPIRRQQCQATGAATQPTRNVTQGATVSLCMIVKNGASQLGKCLASVRDLVHEMIVVDTGSADETKQVAQAHGAKVFDFEWVDSFAAARNESLRHATGEWIFWLDADEHLDEENRTRLRALFQGLGQENAAYVMRQFSPLADGPHAAAQVDQVRLFRNHPGNRWEYRVHEQILPAVRRQGGDLRHTEVVIAHSGFADPATQQSKIARNLRLLEQELADAPDDAFVLYNLGAVAGTDGRPAQALDYLRRSLAQSRPGDTLIGKLHALIVRTHHQQGQRNEALAACRAGRAAVPQDAELLFWEAILRRESKDLEGATACLVQVLQGPEERSFTAADAGLRGYRTRNLLGEIYREQDRAAEAESQWRAAAAECPNFTAVWRNLAELFLGQGRWQELDQAAEQLQADPQSALDGAVLRARGCLAQGVPGRTPAPGRYDCQGAASGLAARPPQPRPSSGREGPGRGGTSAAEGAGTGTRSRPGTA